MKLPVVSRIKLLALGFCLGTTNFLMAQALEREAAKAKGAFMQVLQIGLGVMSAVVMVSGLVLSAVKFSKKDEGATWYLIGTVGASVLLGAAAAYA